MVGIVVMFLMMVMVMIDNMVFSTPGCNQIFCSKSIFIVYQDHNHHLHFMTMVKMMTMMMMVMMSVVMMSVLVMIVR